VYRRFVDGSGRWREREGVMHHQLEQIRTELANRQVVFFVGARGTGKTRLKSELEVELMASGVAVIALDAADVVTPGDLNEPLADALGHDPALLTDDDVPRDKTIRIMIDNCEQLHRLPWLPFLQDQWRGLLSLQQARGRIALLLLGRPLFRGAAGGRGSPLLNIGRVVTARPLTRAEALEAFPATDELMSALLQKTGGHPYLTSQLYAHLEGSLDQIAEKMASFGRDHRRYVMRLIDDHGLAARGLVADLLDAAQPVAQSALLTRHFGEAVLQGEDCLEDMCASGLLSLAGDLCALSAAVVKSVPAVRTLVGTPDIDIPVEPTEEHASASETLFRAENALRKRVAAWLTEHDQAWCPARVPEGLVADAELRRRAELDSSVPSAKDQHPLLYLTFGELVSTISASANWDQVFHLRLGLTRPAFDAAIRDFTAIRNKVAHSREVGQGDLAVLGTAIKRLGLADGD
jgi:hypothetical protein